MKVKVNGRKLPWEAAINILHPSTLLSSRGRKDDKLPSSGGVGGPWPPFWSGAFPAVSLCPLGPGAPVVEVIYCRCPSGQKRVGPAWVRRSGGPCLAWSRKQALPPPKHGEPLGDRQRHAASSEALRPPSRGGVTSRSTRTRMIRRVRAASRYLASRA